MSRLARPARRADRPRTKVSFTFDGKQVEAYEGDTIGSALYAAGQRTFSRSFKYHRRRGLMCCAGQCPNCIVRRRRRARRAGLHRAGPRGHQGRARQRACRRSSFDAMRATDIVGGPFTPPGFYYKTFIRPRKLWPLYEKVLRNAAGLGKLRERAGRARVAHRVPPPPRRRARRRRWPRRAAARPSPPPSWAPTSCSPTRARSPGGQQLARGRRGARSRASSSGPARPASRSSTAPRRSGYFDGLVPVWQGDTLHQVRAARHVFATGAIEQPLVFAGNDLPGVMLSGGARRLAALYARQPRPPRRGRHHLRPRPGRRRGAARRGRRDRGGRRPAPRGRRRRPRAARQPGIPVFAGPHGDRGHGRKAVNEAVLAPGRRPAARSTRSSATCWSSSGGTIPATSLLLQAGARSAYDARPAGISRWPSCPTASTPPARSPALTATRRSPRSGELAGLEAAHALGLRQRPSSRGRAQRARRARRRDRRDVAVAAAGQRQRPRQVLRLPVRGRHQQGRPPARSRRAMTRSSSPSATRR